LEVWQRACRLAVETFEEFRSCDFINLKNQIERSALSIPSNIAKGSCGEFRTQLYIASKLKVLESRKSKPLITESREISAMIEGLRKSITNPKKQKTEPKPTGSRTTTT
jgi:hypothetical protein